MEERTYTFVKNIKGSLAINLESYDMAAPVKKFVIPFNVSKIVVPYRYALGLFVSPDALTQYKLGCFTVDDKDSLIKDAIEKGLCAGEDYPEINSMVEIEKAVKGNKVAKIREIITNGTRVEKDNLIALAKEHVGTLTTVCKNLIEQNCGVELEIE